MQIAETQLVIIGGGPAGYVAAIRTAKQRIKTILIEKEEEEIGGVCLNRGCIPTKHILNTAITAHKIKKLKDRGIDINGELKFNLSSSIRSAEKVVGKLRKGIMFLLRRNSIKTIYGRASIVDENTVEVEGMGQIKAEKILIAAGGRPKALAAIPFDGSQIIDTSMALKKTHPPERITIVGAGAAGMELALIYTMHGSKVKIVEIMPDILPFMDEDISKVAEKECRKMNIKIFNSTEVKGYEKKNGAIVLRCVKKGKKGKNESLNIECDLVVVTAGTTPNTDSVLSDKIKTKFEIINGFIKTDEHKQTSIPSIYAAGDITGPPLLAHSASVEGIIAVDNIAGDETKVPSAELVPSVVYFHPPAAMVGLTEKEALTRGYNIKVSKFPFAANSMAVAKGEEVGFIKIIEDVKQNTIIGIHIFGCNAEELISEAATIVTLKIKINQLEKIIHPHPTTGEVFHESFMKLLDKPIHII